MLTIEWKNICYKHGDSRLLKISVGNNMPFGPHFPSSMEINFKSKKIIRPPLQAG